MASYCPAEREALRLRGRQGLLPYQLHPRHGRHDHRLVAAPAAGIASATNSAPLLARAVHDRDQELGDR